VRPGSGDKDVEMSNSGAIPLLPVKKGQIVEGLGKYIKRLCLNVVDTLASTSFSHKPILPIPWRN
jgi:hypothetical protein